jgi:peptidoglycan/xylan/chitin deacetylase (PgdA/CDA1 family)
MTSTRSCILTYHSLDTTGSVISIPPEMFRKQMAWLAETGAPVVPLAKVQETPGAVALTFDDAFRNFFEYAFPVLRQYNFPATLFVITSYCGLRNNWPSQPLVPAIPTFELMPWVEVEEVARAGIEIGSHSATHARMSQLSEAEVEEELRVSRRVIEDRIGKTIETFAYPYGDFTPAVRTVVGRHFRLACSTELEFVSPKSDPLSLPRIDVYYLRNQFWFHGLRRRHGAQYLAGRKSLRDLRRSIGVVF